MALPTSEKTWTHDTNNLVNTGSDADDMTTILLAMKNTLVSGGWVVRRSSNATSVADSDLWSTIADLNWGTTGARSWIVLRNTALSDGAFDLLIECRWGSSTYVTHLQLYVAAEGYNLDGSISSLPTAIADQCTIYYYATASHVGNFISTDNTDKYWNSSISSDKECTRFWVFQGGYCTTFLQIDAVKNPVSGLVTTDQWFVSHVRNAASSTTNRMLSATFNAYSGVGGSDVGTKSYSSGNGIVGYALTAESAGGTTLTSDYIAANPDDGSAWPLLPMGLSTKINISWAYGRNGEVFDLWWGSDTLAIGSTYPSTGAKSFIQIGCFVLPWDGSVPSIS